MHFARRGLAVFAALAVARWAPLAAQGTPELRIELPPSSQLAQVGPIVIARDMLSSERTREPLAAGFPARFHFLVTLWSEDALANSVVRRAEYTVLVDYIAMEKKYQVLQVVNDRPLSLGKFDRVEDAEGAIARPTRVPITAISSRRKLYYRVTLDVEILQLSDFDEVNRWLKGEVAPAIHGDRDPGTALARSVRRLLARVLGGETREFEAKTPPFTVP
jgi:hypothetical protein